jgi:folate-binding protein YgfZ
MHHSPLLPIQRHLAGEGLVLAPAVGGDWELPARYTHHGVPDEYEAILRPHGVGVTDRSWRSVLRLTGPDRHAFLQGMISNDVAALTPGRGCRAAFLDTTGHILADLYVHALPDALLVETDPRCLARLAETLKKYLIMEDVTITDVSSQWAVLSVQGEGALSALAAVLDPSLPSDLMPLGNVAVTTTDGTAGVLVSLSHSLMPGFDLWLPVDTAPAVWETLVTSGVTPVGEEAAEILRIEARLAVWGHELDPSVLLPEAELADAVSYTKGCYIGQEIIARLQARGHTNRALRAVLFGPEAPVPHPDDTLHVPENQPDAGREVGRLTSAIASPQFGGNPLTLAYIRKEYLGEGTPLDVQIRQPDGTMFSFAGTVHSLPKV